MRYTLVTLFDNVPVSSPDALSEEIDSTSFTDVSAIAVTSGALTGNIHMELSNDGIVWADTGELLHGVGSSPVFGVFTNLTASRMRFRFLSNPFPAGNLTLTIKSNGR